MSTNYTESFDLCQWEPVDQVQRVDFNADNAKVDAALTARNCQIYMTSYTGTGAGDLVFTFPSKPMFVTIMGGLNTLFCTIQGSTHAHTRLSPDSLGVSSVEWSGNTLTVHPHAGGAKYYSNASGENYVLLALLDLES